MSTTLLETYKALLNRRLLSADTGQASLVGRLAQLQAALSNERQGDGLQGLYIYGGVGTGKSRLADMFCATLPSKVTRRRAHFHEFMLDMHSRLHRARSSSGYSEDPLPKIGRQIRDESRVLCFDEFQVTDIADAMILQRLFGSIWASGGMVVSTSNRAPDDLYENGLNRSVFLPFIELLKQKCQVWKMEGTQDYRFLASSDYQQTFFTDEDSFRLRVEKAKAGQTPTMHTIPVMMGRKLSLTATPVSGDVQSLAVYSSFSDLCARNVGAQDYIALCRKAKLVFLDGLHRFRARDLDYAKRFITLVDTAYESRTKIFIFSHDPLKDVFREIVQVEQKRSDSHSQMAVRKGGGSSSSMMSTFVSGDMEWSATGLAEASLATGGAGETDVVFAIGRAVSRLHEMGSSIYGQRG